MHVHDFFSLMMFPHSMLMLIGVGNIANAISN